MFKVSSRSAATPASSSSQSSNQADSARARAIAMLAGGSANAQATPVKDPSSVSIEEMTNANKAESSPEVKTEASTDGQTSSSEASAETALASPEATKEAEEPLSSQYANLARKEKALRAKAQANEQALKARETALLAREEAIKAKDSEYQSKYIPKDKLASMSLTELSDLGLSYDQLTNLALNAPKPEDVTRAKEFKALEDKIALLEANQNKTQKSYEDNQQQAYKQAVEQIRTETKSLVLSNPEFETIKETNSINDVVDLIEQTFKQDGVLLSVEDAAKAVEDHLVEEAMKLMKITKLKNKFMPSPAASAPSLKTQETSAPKQSQMKTLTNNISTSRQLSARERAILAFKGEKKN